KELKDGTSGDDDAYHKITYGYDAFGDITSIGESGGATVVYPDHDALRYDGLHQLTGSTIVIGNTTGGRCLAPT
ncbi:MAG TPA: hypothetical protein VM658_15940, partial [bacterium]|nr:hypothetical protein [bacterium]